MRTQKSRRSLTYLSDTSTWQSFVRGTDVIISGLSSRPELNGECGKVISFEDGRYGVKIDRDGGKSEAIRLKPPNVAAREYAAGLKLDANFMPVLQRSSPGQLAWLLGEYGAAEEHARFVEVALLFAAVLAFPDQVGYPSAWDRDGVSNCVAFLRAGGHKAILKIGAAKHLEKNAAVAERCAQVVMGLADDRGRRRARLDRRLHRVRRANRPPRWRRRPHAPRGRGRAGRRPSRRCVRCRRRADASRRP